MIIDTVYNEDGEFVREEPFDADVELDKLYPTELTNEEHLKSLDTEQFAEWIAKCIKDTINLTNGNRKYTDNIVSTKWWVEWLKQPHTKE